MTFMKINLWKIIAISVALLMICGSLVSANLSIRDDQRPNDEDGEITVHLPVGMYEIKTTDFITEVSLEGYGRLLIPGKPNLPSKIFSIAIPPGTIVQDVQFHGLSDVILPGTHQIAPCVLPRVIGVEDPAIYASDQRRCEDNYLSVYGQDNPYPSSIGEVVGTGGYRTYNLIDVRINPVTYYPLSGKLIYTSDISVTIRYTYPEGFSKTAIAIDTLPRTEQTARKIILNYDDAQPWYPPGPRGREQYEYVIITLDTLVSSVTPLVNWEKAKGRSVNVITTSWISDNYEGYDLAAKMRVFLREKYPANVWGIIDVCLVGGYDDVPMRRVALDLGNGQPETDYYYAELSLPDNQSWDEDGDYEYAEQSDPIDFIAEINVGRIPWSDPSTVEHICEKSVAYEQNTNPGFKRNILLLGAFFWPDTDNAVLMEKKVDQDWMKNWTMTRLYEEAQSTYECDYDLTYDNVESVWSEGTYAFVNWAGHGQPQYSLEYYPSIPFVDEQTCLSLNDDYPAIIFADACSNSDTDELNIGQAMLKQGAVGFVGATKSAYGHPGWNDPYDGSSQSLDYFFTSCCTSGEYTQGEALQWALREMIVYGLWSSRKFETLEWSSLWGNPDLSMNTPPLNPTITGPSQVKPNVVQTFTVNAIDDLGHTVTFLLNWGDGTGQTWFGPYESGEPVELTHTWEKKGSYTIKAMAIDQFGLESNWTYFEVVCPTENRFTMTMFLQHLFERFPNVFPMLRYFMGQ